MLLPLLICVFFLSSYPALAAVRINEIADKGSASVCAGEDWVELFNPGSSSFNLSGFTLHDDKGTSDSNAFHFLPSSSVTIIGPDSYVLLCTRSESVSVSPKFKIGGSDTITLRNPDGDVVSTSGELPGLGASGLAWANASGIFRYTATPTPGTVNVFSEPWALVRAGMAKQDVDGEGFFSSVDTGAVVTVQLTMV